MLLCTNPVEAPDFTWKRLQSLASSPFNTCGTVDLFSLLSTSLIFFAGGGNGLRKFNSQLNKPQLEYNTIPKVTNFFGGNKRPDILFWHLKSATNFCCFANKTLALVAQLAKFWALKGLTYCIGGPSIACRRGVNVFCRVWLSIGDLEYLDTASYSGLQMACGWVGTVVVACVLAEVLQVVPDGVGGAGGVGTDGCWINNDNDN